MKNKDIFRLGYSVSMTAVDTAELMLYGEIIQDTREEWKWSKEDKSARDFDKAIKEIKENGAKKLLLRINSPGGVCTQAVAMRSIISEAGFEDITIRIEGMCASAATDVATIPGAHVQITEGSEYMIHNPWCLAMGNANDFEHIIQRLRNIEANSIGFYQKKTGQSEEQLKEWMDAETWFTAEQAVEYGFADELIEAKSTKAVACATMDVMRSLYRAVPDRIMEEPKEEINGPKPVDNIPKMEEKHMTLEELRASDPDLYNQICQDATNAAVTAERERIDEIDALTMPGYETMAMDAKKNGLSAAEFQKQVVAAMKQKGNDFVSARKEETAPANNVAGSAPSAMTEEDEIEANAKAVAAYANAYASNNELMY